MCHNVQIVVFNLQAGETPFLLHSHLPRNKALAQDNALRQPYNKNGWSQG